MKNLLIILSFIMIGCQSDAQQEKTKTPENKIVLENGILLSFEGIDISRFEVNINYFEVKEITKDHLLCLATDECDEKLIRQLLAKGANINFKCEDVETFTKERIGNNGSV